MTQYLVPDWVLFLITAIMLTLIIQHITVLRRNGSLKELAERLNKQLISDRHTIEAMKDLEIVDKVQIDRQQRKITDLLHQVEYCKNMEFHKDVLSMIPSRITVGPGIKYEIVREGGGQIWSKIPVYDGTLPFSSLQGYKCLNKRVNLSTQKQRRMWRYMERGLQDKALYLSGRFMHRQELDQIIAEDPWYGVLSKRSIFSEESKTNFRKALDNLAMWYAATMIKRWESEIERNPYDYLQDDQCSYCGGYHV